MATLRTADYAGGWLDQTLENIRLGVLTASGISDVLDMRTSGPGVNVQYVVRSINTNIVVVLEGSEDNINFAELGSQITKTTNGDFGIVHPYKINYIRFRFVSESGGTSAVITVDANPHAIG